MDFLQCGHTANESKGLAFNRGGYRYVNKYSIFRSWRRDKHYISQFATKIKISMDDQKLNQSYPEPEEAYRKC